MTGRRFPVVAVAGAAAFYLLMVWRLRFVCDDAFISFRYARNLIHGIGLRYNPGTDPPVEGYSNLLWVLWTAPAEGLGLDPTVWAPVWSSVSGLLLFVYLMLFVHRRIAVSNLATAGTAFFVAGLPPLAVWSTGGLETLPFTLAIFALYERLLGDPERPHPLQAGGIALAASLLRTDGALLPLAILGVAGIASLAPERRFLRRSVLVATGILVTGVLLHVGWRYGYYGDFVSNTARAKMNVGAIFVERGALYAGTFLLVFPALAVIVALAPVLSRGIDRGRVWQCLLVVSAVFAQAISVGGDFMAMGRFMVPALPFIAVLLATLLNRVGRDSERRRFLAVGSVAVCTLVTVAPAFNLHLVPRSTLERFDFRQKATGFRTEYEVWRVMKENAERWSQLGRALALVAKPGESLITGVIGAIGYYSNLFIYDRYGLVTREVALLPPRPGPVQPGHDHLASFSFFQDKKPTYWTAMIRPREEVEGKAREWAKEMAGLPYGIEVHDLPPDQGFPEDSSLLLLRRRAGVDEQSHVSGDPKEVSPR